VTNTGNVTIHGIKVTDTFTAPSAGDKLGTPITCPTYTLAPGKHTTCTATYRATAADVRHGTINNEAGVGGTAPGGGTVTSPPSTSTIGTSGLKLVKSVSPTTVTRAGQTVTYSFLVTNTGNERLHDLTVTDTFTAPSSADKLTAITCPTTSLAAGKSTTCTATYKVTQADVDHGVIHNSATVTGKDPDGTSATSPPSKATVTAPARPALTVVKTADPTVITTVGQVVTYSFLATDTGNVTIHDLKVEDTLAAPAGPAITKITCPVTTLAPGRSTTCTATYTVTQADITNGGVKNTATVTGVAPAGGSVTSPPSTVTVSVSGTAPVVTTPPATGTPPGSGTAPEPNPVAPSGGTGPLAFTGMGSFDQLVAGGILSVLAGLGLIILSTRRRRRSA
jgi:uncharacterized repeat protein (TIGR01451 family)